MKLQNIITPQKYENISEDEQFFYDPDYRKEKVKKIRSYEICDLGHEHFMGWIEKRIPIGEPYRYIRDNSITRQSMKYIMPDIVDSINNSNVLADRVFNKRETRHF